jgi:S1-C subfamily serine protease/Tfp pilus assembly protein PilF
VHERGVPVHVFSPDVGDEPESFKRGMWVYAFPIPTDEQLDASNLTVLISHLLTAKEPGLSVNQKAKVAAELGTLKAVAMSSEGTRAKGGNWKGRVLVAVQDDSYLVCSYGGPPEEWPAISAQCEAALKTFVAPVKLTSIAEPPVPPQTQRPRDVSSSLVQATPLVRVKWRKDIKDSGTLGLIGGYGTGFIIRDDGYVVTNRHVVQHCLDKSGAGRVAYDPVQLTWDQTTNIPPQDADVVAISDLYDLALLKIRGAQQRKWPVVPLADISNVRLTDNVLVAGWPSPGQFGKTDINITGGRLTAIQRDARGRPIVLRHDARTTGGNSGGPMYDLDVGAVVGVHFQSYFNERARDGQAPVVETLYYGAVPVHRILWEFPQIATGQTAENLSPDDRRTLIAYYFLQKRYGAAMIECARALEDDPKDGLVNAFMYRIYQSQSDSSRADSCLETALVDARSKVPAMLLAAEAHLGNGKIIDANMWACRLLQESPLVRDGYVALSRCSQGSIDQLMNMPKFKDDFASDPEMLMLHGRGLVMNWMRSRGVRQLPATNGPFRADAIAARASLNRSMEMWPGYRARCYAYLAILAMQDGEKTKALELREKAIGAAPKDLEVRLALAHFDMLRGDLNAASENIQEALSIKVTPHGQFLRGWMLAVYAQLLEKDGKLKEAQQHRVVASACLRAADTLDQRNYWGIESTMINAHVEQAFARTKARLEEKTR